MVPDLPLFFPFVAKYSSTHSLAGLIVACLPLGLACCVVYELFIHHAVVAIMPTWIQHRRMRPATALNVKRLPNLGLAVVIGAATHVCWDSFTHADRWGSELFPALNDPAMTIFGSAIPWFRVLQYGSTVVLLPVLVLWLWKTLQEEEPLYRPFTFSQRTKVLAATTGVVLPIVIGVWNLQSEASAYAALGSTIKQSGTALLTAVTALGIFIQAKYGDAFGRLS